METNQWEFRINYTHKRDVLSNYHYYVCETAKEALKFQMEMIERKKWNIKINTVERFDRFADKWVDESFVISEILSGNE